MQKKSKIHVPFYKEVPEEEISEVVSKLIKFRASSLSGCPKSYVEILKGADFSNQSKSFFIQGTRTHYFREKLTTPGVSMENETRFYIKHPKRGYYITGKMDHIFLDEHGVVLLDYKSAKFGAFYYKLKDGIPANNRAQLGIYKYIYYVNTGVVLKEGAIRYVDKENSRNHIQLSTNLPELSEIEDSLINHPAIKCIMDNDLEAIEIASIIYNQKYPFFCDFCNVVCQFNKKNK